ncbi:MAG: hypothetical protein E6J91_38790 [Deltaproteobacteria bacterium]|nr:MAG: hypothetical protein E6J91_38790 [Deltaproteobacteria bacterium]
MTSVATPAPATRPDRPALGGWLRALFVTYLAATAVHISIVVAHEPFAFDAWNVAVDTGARPFSFGRLFDYGILEYTHANPRIGQWLGYLAYKLVWFAPIATPLAFLAVSLAVTVLGLGRWPAWRRGRDLALWAIALGSLWFALPRIGMIMFCRAYCANYLYGAAIQLWFVALLRLGSEASRSRLAMAGYAALGIAAGMANEHTGPALVAFAVGHAVLRRRRLGRFPPLAASGAIGAVVGFAAIFFAPGQGERYEGLATKVSLVGRLLQRGVTSNLDIYRDFVIGTAPVLALIAAALILDAFGDTPPSDASGDAARRRAAIRLLGWAAIAGTLITATVFVSPKLGPRFYLHSCALVLAAFVGILDATAPSPRRLVPFALVAAFASVYAGVRTVPLFLRLAEQSDERLALLAAAPRGAMVTVESFDQVDDSWWFLGDDLRKPNQRDLIAGYFGLGGVVFRAVDLDAPLGVSDVRLVPHYRVTPASCRDEHGGFEITGFRGLDVASIQRAMLDGVARTRARLAGAGQLERLDLTVELAGAPPALPRRTLLVGRWQPDRFDAWAGAIERRGVGRTRSVVLPPALQGKDLEIFVYHLGGPAGGVARRLGTARDAHLDYLPWSRGGYWALACNPDECFVIAATRVL